MKGIINFWNHKDIPEVIKEYNQLDMDKLDFNYMRYPNPHIAFDKILQSGMLDTYDYAIFQPPDLIVKQENIDQLVKDIEETKGKVVTGVCNVDYVNNYQRLAVCVEPVVGFNYKWIRRFDKVGLHEVWFNGMSLMAIHIQTFKNFKFYEGTHDDPIDLKICKWCNENNIKVYSNFDNFMTHMRYKGQDKFGSKNPEIRMNGRKIKTDYTGLVEPIEFA